MAVGWAADASHALESHCWRQAIFTKPIEYSIPARKWEQYRGLRSSVRSNHFAPLIPGDPATYHYDEELPYLQMYASSFFCITKKKGGWDCLRHYEILLSGCMPYFLDIEFLPGQSMANFPRHLIQALMALPGVPSQGDLLLCLQNGTRPRLGRSFSVRRYDDLRRQVLRYVERHMLSGHRATELTARRSVLVHSEVAKEKPVDYLRELLIIGFLELGLEVYVTCNVSWIFEDFDTASLEPIWKNSYGRGFLYERAVAVASKQKLFYWRPGDALPEQPFTYLKTTYNNYGFPEMDYVERGADLLVDGNDIWAPHDDASFQREGLGCYELTPPAQVLLAALDSGVLWSCDESPGGAKCPDLHAAASLWYRGLEQLPLLQAHKSLRNDITYQEILGDIEDYLQTPPSHADFVQKYMAIATNSRQFLDAYRTIVVRTDRRQLRFGPRAHQADGTSETLAACGRVFPTSIHHACHWGRPAHGIVAALTCRGDAEQLRWCMVYGLSTSLPETQQLWKELLSTPTAHLPPLLPRARDALLHQLFPDGGTEAAAAARALMELDYSAPHLDLETELTAWQRWLQVLRWLQWEDYELQAYVRQRMVGWKSPGLALRKPRWGMLEQIASLAS